MALPTWEEILPALAPIRCTIPVKTTRTIAIIMAYSATSWPSPLLKSSEPELPNIFTALLHSFEFTFFLQHSKMTAPWTTIGAEVASMLLTNVISSARSAQIRLTSLGLVHTVDHDASGSKRATTITSPTNKPVIRAKSPRCKERSSTGSHPQSMSFRLLLTTGGWICVTLFFQHENNLKQLNYCDSMCCRRR